MARSPIALHPSVRERIEPRMSAAALAEYLILKSDQQETILHNSRFLTGPIVAKYGDAMRALVPYNANPRRSKDDLDRVRRALIARAGSADLRPSAREEALRCIEAIDLFLVAENALGMNSLPLVEAPRFAEMRIEEVAISIQPNWLVRPIDTDGSGQRVGAVMLRLQKAPDPGSCRLEATKERRGEHRREMARYMVAMMQMVIEDQATEYGRFDRDLCFVADVRLGERIGAATDHSARLRAIRSACKQIAATWDSILPRESIRQKA